MSAYTHYVEAMKELNAPSSVVELFKHAIEHHNLPRIISACDRRRARCNFITGTDATFVCHKLDNLACIGADIRHHIDEEKSDSTETFLLKQQWDGTGLRSITETYLNSELSFYVSKVKDFFSDLRKLKSNLESTKELTEQLKDDDEMLDHLIIRFMPPENVSDAKEIIRIVQYALGSNQFDWMLSDDIKSISLYRYFEAVASLAE